MSAYGTTSFRCGACGTTAGDFMLVAQLERFAEQHAALCPGFPPVAEVETLRAALQAVWDDVYLHETIEKLRELADRKTGYIYSDEVLTLRNAAAELERVTAALRAMIDDLIIHGNHTRWRIAKVDDALAGGARAAQGDK
jgi:hypothetical protein